MRRRGIRISQIVVIAAALAVALFGTWYRAFVSKDGFFAQGGVMGLVIFLVGQLLLNVENELATETVNYRIDALESRMACLEYRVGDGTAWDVRRDDRDDRWASLEGPPG